MSEIENKNPESTQTEGVDLTRRRLAKAGFAGSGVLLTLTSQPVLGTTAVQCTISGNLSGNLSRQPPTQSCDECGTGKDYWEPKTECKDKDFSYYLGSDCSDYKDNSYRNKCSWVLKPSYDNFCLKKGNTTTDYGKGYESGYGGCTQNATYPSKYDDSVTAYNKGKNDGKNYAYSVGYKKVDTKGYRDGYFEYYDTHWKYWGHNYSQREYQRGYRDGYEQECRRQYGYESDHCKGELWDFARECLIATLNTKYKCYNNYGVTEYEVKKMWSDCKNGGQYQVRPGTYWTRTDCINYLKQLHKP